MDPELASDLAKRNHSGGMFPGVFGHPQVQKRLLFPNPSLRVVFFSVNFGQCWFLKILVYFGQF